MDPQLIDNEETAVVESSPVGHCRSKHWTREYMHYVYILVCANGLLYTGMTWNVDKRLEQHQSGRYRRSWTAHRGPVSLAFSHEVCCRSCAYKTEQRIKKLRKQDKLSLIDDPSKLEPIRCELYPKLRR